jgi:class 3 adenylate cyclase
MLPRCALDMPSRAGRVHMAESRKLAAILAADIVGYSRIAGMRKAGVSEQ